MSFMNIPELNVWKKLIFFAFQSALISAFKRKNIDAFKYALEHLQANPNLIDPRFEKSVFEEILQTPQSSEFIILCIDNDADLYLVKETLNLSKLSC